MPTKAKKYTASDKAKIALEAIKGDMTYAQISSKYSVHSTQIHKWKKILVDGMTGIFQQSPAKVDTEKEQLIEELYKQIGQLAVERDWLKKKSELFS
jgi:transposase-like protein